MEHLEIIYLDNSVMSFIRGKVDEVSHLLANTARLENRIFKRLNRYYKHQEQSKRSIKRIKQIVHEEISDAFKRQRVERAIRFDEIEITNGFGEPIEYEPKDVLADVEGAAINNSLAKKIIGLASDDRERFTLNAWQNGYNDLEIAKELALLYGGKIEGHRSFIKRFKADCRLAVA